MVFSPEKIIFYIFLLLLFTKVLFQIILEVLNLTTIKENKNNQQIKKVMEEPTLLKTINYSLAKGKFTIFKIIYSATILLGVIMSDFISDFYRYISAYSENTTLVSSIFVLSFMLLFSLTSLPLSLFNTFFLEEKFGFNKTTIKVFISDLVKSFILSIVFLFPLLLILFTIVESFGANWWLLGAGFIIVFQLIVQFIFPKFILPLFNKLTPLPEGGLREEIIKLANKLKFNTKEILVMDGSKRSKHSNAFFTGFGKSRRVVFFDTLIEQLKINELKAVFAHEVGHYKKKHILQGLAMGMVMTFIGFGILSWLITSPNFYLAFNLTFPELAQAFLIFLLISDVITFWLSPVFNLFSRKNEYEADAYAKQNLQEGQSLVDALKKLYLENLSNLNPHPFYSFFYYSHPTFFEREKKLLQE